MSAKRACPERSRARDSLPPRPPAQTSRAAMDAHEVQRVRVRHAVRVATGGTVIASIGLTTAATSSCLTSVLFFVATIAGTPENYQAFQLRTAALTFLGAFLGTCAYALVHLIAGASTVGVFFAAIPFILAFSSLRPDASLNPLPPVANVLLGLLTISRFATPRTTIPETFAFAIADAALACATAVLVSLPFPDRAADLGRRIVARELRLLGSHISRVATKTFSPVPVPTPDHNHTTSAHRLSLFVRRGLDRRALDAGLLDDDYVFFTDNFPRRYATTTIGIERTQKMIRESEQALAFLRKLRPFGRTKVSDYAHLARANQLLTAATNEPTFLPRTIAQWRNATAWTQLINALHALVSKVSALESVSCTGEDGSSRFSRRSVLHLFGEAYIPLWVSHYASCAAACGAMALTMRNGNCREMFYLPEEEAQGVRGSCPLHETIDPRKWRSRRAEMYYGFLLRYRARVHNASKPRSYQDNVADLRALESNDIRGLDLVYDVRVGLSRRDQDKNTDSNTNLDADEDAKESLTRPGSLGELQALSFFGVASHSLGEEIGHVQSAMVSLAASSRERSILSPFAFVVVGVPLLWNRIKRLFSLNVPQWEVRFMLSHSLLLIVILALVLFLPFIDTFESSEIAWVFSSAALAAQLSAEPTLFIGIIRIFATITGTATAFGFSSILNAAGRASRPSLQYLMIPYIFVVTVTCLLTLPSSVRYAAFLLIVTNAIMLFCPRSTENCSEVLANQSEECFPNWEYAISRSVNVSLGVVFAFFFHVIFWPRFANQEALRCLSKAYINAARLLGKLRRTYFSYGLLRRKWLVNAKDSDENSSSENSSTPEESLDDRDLYRKDEAILGSLRTHISSHITSAVLIVKAEAAVWRSGPLRMSPLITQVLSDFIALDVTLLELAALLGRRPIFSESYGRSAHEHFINPLLPYYETIQISVNNLVGVIHRIIADGRDHGARENCLELYQSIVHLARMRTKLRCEAEDRAKRFHHKDFMTLQVRKRLSSWISYDKIAAKRSKRNEETMLPEELQEEKLRRARSTEDLTTARRDSTDLSVDDVVLYNTFSFIADGCLSAFVRVAINVLTHMETKLEKKKDEKSKKG